MCVCAQRRTVSARAAQSGRTAEEKSPAADRATERPRPEGTEQRLSAPGRSRGADSAAAGKPTPHSWLLWCLLWYQGGAPVLRASHYGEKDCPVLTLPAVISGARGPRLSAHPPADAAVWEAFAALRKSLTQVPDGVCVGQMNTPPPSSFLFLCRGAVMDACHCRGRLVFGKAGGFIPDAGFRPEGGVCCCDCLS